MMGLQEKYRQLSDLLRVDIFALDLDRLPRVRRAIYTFIKICVIVCHGVARDQCVTQAAALTFITLVSLVPLLAFVFSIAKGLNAQQLLEQSINDYLMAMPGPVETFVEQIFNLVNSTSFTPLGLIGLGIVIWSIHQVLGAMEKTFNIIWGVKKNRTFARQASDYLLIVIVTPVLFVTSSALIAISSNHINAFLAKKVGDFIIVYEFFFEFSGMLGIFAAFSFLYGFLPNLKVKISSALIGGVVAGASWYGVQWFFIKFNVGVTSYNAIYGAFAAIPLFLVWLYTNWLVVLIGAEISYAWQQHRTYVDIEAPKTISFASRFRLASLIVRRICNNFDEDNGPWPPEQLQHAKYIPKKIVLDILSKLSEGRVVVEAKGGGFVPAKKSESIRLDDVYTAIWGKPDHCVFGESDSEDQQIFVQLDEVEAKVLAHLNTTQIASLPVPRRSLEKKDDGNPQS